MLEQLLRVVANLFRAFWQYVLVQGRSLAETCSACQSG